MKNYLLILLVLTGGYANAACEDMYFWARMLQPGMCTPRTEYENRQIASEESWRARGEAISEMRRNAELSYTRAALAQTYGVSPESVSVSAQRTRDGYGSYSINNGQYVCQHSPYSGGISCLDTGGNYARGLSAAQEKWVRAHSWDAVLNDQGELIPRAKEKAGPKNRR